MAESGLLQVRGRVPLPPRPNWVVRLYARRSRQWRMAYAAVFHPVSLAAAAAAAAAAALAAAAATAAVAAGVAAAAAFVLCFRVCSRQSEDPSSV